MFKWLIVLFWYKFSWTFMVRQQKWTALGTQQSQGRLAQNKAHAHCETFWTAWVLVFQLWVHIFCILDLVFVVTQCSSSNRPTLSRSANGKKLCDCWIVADFRSVWMADSAADPVCETDRNLEQTESKNKELIRWTAFFSGELAAPMRLHLLLGSGTTQRLRRRRLAGHASRRMRHCRSFSLTAGGWADSLLWALCRLPKRSRTLREMLGP